MSLTTNIIAAWRLDEASGSRADATGNGWTLTQSGSVGSGTGKRGNAASFDGTDYLESSASLDDAFVAAGALTVAGWVKANGVSSDQTIVRNDGGAGDVGLLLRFTSGGNLEGRLLGSGPDVVGATALSSGTWYHAAMTWDGTTLTTYLNGSVESSDGGGGSYTGSGGGFRVGSYGGGEFWSGLIDELYVWSRALSGAEIVTLASATAVGYYPFVSGSLFRPASLSGLGAGGSLLTNPLN